MAARKDMSMKQAGTTAPAFQGLYVEGTKNYVRLQGKNPITSCIRLIYVAQLIVGTAGVLYLRPVVRLLYIALSRSV